LEDLIRDRFADDIEPVFDAGYIQGSCVVRVRSKEDMAEMWSDVRKGKNNYLWCDGLKPSPEGRGRILLNQIQNLTKRDQDGRRSMMLMKRWMKWWVF
jgi:hypothetical protein